MNFVVRMYWPLRGSLCLKGPLLYQYYPVTLACFLQVLARWGCLFPPSSTWGCTIASDASRLFPLHLDVYTPGADHCQRRCRDCYPFSIWFYYKTIYIHMYDDLSWRWYKNIATTNRQCSCSINWSVHPGSPWSLSGSISWILCRFWSLPLRCCSGPWSLQTLILASTALFESHLLFLFRGYISSQGRSWRF